MYLDFSHLQIALMALIFAWTAFVRSGIGFGGIALGMPFMLLVHDEAMFWLPIFGTHLLFFSAITLRKRFRAVDWRYLQQISVYILPAALLGIFSLLTLPNHYIITFIYCFSIFYAFTWLANWKVNSRQGWLDKFLLGFGGYIIGSGMPGMPLISSVVIRFVSLENLRNTLFVLISTLTIIRMGTFVAVEVNMHFLFALCLIPTAWIGHHFGMRAHDAIINNQALFKKVIGTMLILVSSLGLLKVYL